MSSSLPRYPACVVVKVQEVAAKAAARYAKRVFWADPEDLGQEALVAALMAVHTWDETTGVPYEAYAWRACMLHLYRFVWRASSPVYAADHKLKVLRGVHRAELVDVHEAPTPGVDSLLAEKRWTEDVREQVGYLLDEHFAGKDAGVASSVVVQAEEPCDVAAATGLPITHVYRVARKARSLLGNNAMLYSLWKEAP